MPEHSRVHPSAGQGKRLQKNVINGWLNLDKPEGMTSTQAVGATKRLLRPRKVGHAGTLDPLATGILPLALGRATKTVAYLMDTEKDYRFTVRFGVQTDTDDTEGEVIASSGSRPSDAEIEAILPQFTGIIQQVPPCFSAKKINGQRAYDLARAGEVVELEPREVHVKTLRLVARPDADTAVFEATCGKGTYVRALARDFGEVLGCKGHITALRRTRVGPFNEQNAISLDRLESLVHNAQHNKGLPPGLEEILAPVETALDDIPALSIDHDAAATLRSGQAVFMSRAELNPGNEAVSDEQPDSEPLLYQALCRNRLVALVECQGRRVTPVRVF